MWHFFGPRSLLLLPQGYREIEVLLISKIAEYLSITSEALQSSNARVGSRIRDWMDNRKQETWDKGKYKEKTPQEREELLRKRVNAIFIRVSAFGACSLLGGAGALTLTFLPLLRIIGRDRPLPSTPLIGRPRRR